QGGKGGKRQHRKEGGAEFAQRAQQAAQGAGKIPGFFAGYSSDGRHQTSSPFVDVSAMARSRSLSWLLAISRYSGQEASSSAWRPRPTMRPSSSTKIWSAWSTVEMRCATMITVASPVFSASARRKAASVL